MTEERVLIARRPLNSESLKTLCNVVITSTNTITSLPDIVSNKVMNEYKKSLDMVGPLAHSAMVVTKSDGKHDLVELLKDGVNVVKNVTLTQKQDNGDHYLVEMNGFEWTMQKQGQPINKGVTTDNISSTVKTWVDNKGGYSFITANCHMATHMGLQYATPGPRGVKFTTDLTASVTTSCLHLPNDPEIIHDIYTFLYIFQEYPDVSPTFSLEPESDTSHVKVWTPDILGDTVIGQVMFQVDYQMKIASASESDMTMIKNGTHSTRSMYIIPDACDNISTDSCTPDAEIQLKIVDWENYCVCQDPNSHKEYIIQNDRQWIDSYTTRINQLTKSDPLWIRLVKGYKAFIYATFIKNHGMLGFDKHEIKQQFDATKISRGDPSVPPVRRTKHTKNSDKITTITLIGGTVLENRDRLIIINNPSLTHMYRINLVIRDLKNYGLLDYTLKYFTSKLPYKLTLRTPSLKLGDINTALTLGYSRSTKNAYFFDQFFRHAVRVDWYNDHTPLTSCEYLLSDNDTINVEIVCSHNFEQWQRFEELFLTILMFNEKNSTIN
jgi:hypothetical protein